MQREILTKNVEDMIDPLDKWDYPKRIDNTLDASIAEEFGELGSSISCKRCGKRFVRRVGKQVFCSRECVGLHRTIMEEARGGSDTFEEWLDRPIDYSYAPEKF